MDGQLHENFGWQAVQCIRLISPLVMTGSESPNIFIKFSHILGFIQLIRAHVMCRKFACILKSIYYTIYNATNCYNFSLQLVKKAKLVRADRHLPDFSNPLANSSVRLNCKVFLLPPSNPNLSLPPSWPPSMPSVYMFTGYLPFLFPLHHLSSPVRVVSSPWADLFMSNGCVGCFFPPFLRPTPCLQQTGSPTACRENRVGWMDALVAAVVVGWCSYLAWQTFPLSLGL